MRTAVGQLLKQQHSEGKQMLTATPGMSQREGKRGCRVLRAELEAVVLGNVVSCQGLVWWWLTRLSLAFLARKTISNSSGAANMARSSSLWQEPRPAFVLFGQRISGRSVERAACQNMSSAQKILSPPPKSMLKLCPLPPGIRNATTATPTAAATAAEERRQRQHANVKVKTLANRRPTGRMMRMNVGGLGPGQSSFQPFSGAPMGAAY